MNPLPMTHLFLFTISPVQDFIRQARKTRDLYAGSRILSELCRTAILALQTQEIQSELIYPHQHNLSLPHRVLAKLSVSQPEQLTTVGAAITTAVEAMIPRLGEEVLTHLGLKTQQPNGFSEQLSQHIQTFWVAVPLGDAYQDHFQQLERAMGAIKSHRPFSQYRYSRSSIDPVLVGEMGRKCAVDGERNVKFYKRTQREQKPMLVLKHKLHILPDEICMDPDIPLRYLQPGEGLSALSFVKRAVHSKQLMASFPAAWQSDLPSQMETDSFDAFPSTAHIAIQDVLDRIDAAGGEAAKHLLDFRTQLLRIPSSGGDEQLYYEENHTEAYFRKQQVYVSNKASEAAAQLSDFRQVYARLHSSTRKLGLQFPSYYAMIRFDGDSMGKWLNGDPAYFRDSSRLDTFHRVLSAHLGRFAAWAFDLLALPAGKAIFAGGDDFLAFVNLDHLFPVLEQLRTGFDKMVNRPIHAGLDAEGHAVGDLGIREDRQLSFSAGLVVAHYKTPLSIVVERVQEAEHRAKQFQDGRKDSLHLMILKKSGESLSASCPWYQEETIATQRLAQIVAVLQQPEGFSPTFLRKWLAHLRPLIGNSGKALADLSQEMILTEGKRLLQRAWLGDSNQRVAASHTFLDLLRPLILYPKEILNFFHLLLICDFLQRNTNGPTS